MRIVRSHFHSRFALCSELCVQNSCVQPAAMSLTPSTIRIGPNKHGYVYIYVGNGIYKCRRGSDWCGTNEVLWLIKEDGHWFAFDAPNDHNPTSVDHEKVRFVSTGAEAHKAGRHYWTMMMSHTLQVGDFWTTIMED